MKIINDSQRLQTYLVKYDILSHFSDSNLPFSLYQFEKGIVLPLASTRDILEKDPIFLTYLLRSVSEKLNRVTAMTVEPKDLRERILHYIRTECLDHRLTGVEKTAGVLHCSKRQLLRHLKA